MRIPGAEAALEHIASWAARGRWKEECHRVLDEHLEPVCAKVGIDEDELAELLGEHHYQMIQACAFEDFLSRRIEPKARNVIDDYLDQRAWKESIPGRDYLRALRDSMMSIYEVVGVKPGRGLVLRDLLRGGEPVEVDERLGSESAVIGGDRERSCLPSRVAGPAAQRRAPNLDRVGEGAEGSAPFSSCSPPKPLYITAPCGLQRFCNCGTLTKGGRNSLRAATLSGPFAAPDWDCFRNISRLLLF